MAAIGTSITSPIVISDDDEPVASDVAAIPAAAHNQWQWQPALESGGYGFEIRRPKWLPDCFYVGVERRCDDGTVILDYTCPVGFMFNSRADVEAYCSSGAFQRALDAKATLRDKTTLQGKYQWLSGFAGWALEIRAGGENLSKMFKFYTHLRTGARFTSEEDCIRYLLGGEIPGCANEECDTSGEDNIIAQLEFCIDGLPLGWVKETAFKKCNGDIRKDPFYTDPINKKVYHSLKSAIEYFKNGIDAESCCPKESVTDMYFSDNCSEMLLCLANRLKIEGIEDQQCEEACQISHLGCYVVPLVSYSVNILSSPMLTMEEEKDGKYVHYGDNMEEEEDEEMLRNKKSMKCCSKWWRTMHDFLLSL